MAKWLATYAAMVLFVIGTLVSVAGTLPSGAAQEEWLPVRETSLVIPHGSPLDFSSLVPVQPAGAQGWVIARPDGGLAYEKAPDQAVRFLCGSLSWSGASGAYPDQHQADLYAEQLRIHGYNLARLHFVDNNLMGGRDRDFDYNPDLVRRLHYLLAALKRNGVGWVFDAQTSENGAYGGVYPHRWIPKHDLKVRVYFDAEARQHWLRLVDDLLGTVNPFTGLRPLDDPALAAVVTFNENGLEFASILDEFKTRRPYPLALQAPFNAWLQATYGTNDKLAAAWGRELGADEDLEKQSIELPTRRYDGGARMRDLQRFFIDSEKETFDWMTAELRKRGYKGLTSAYNNMSTTATLASRGSLPLVTMNTYFDEVLSLDVNYTISQKSSLDDDAKYVQDVFASRWLKRPLFITEHDHMFWNQFRHESGLVMPAYAAFQGWSGICRHAWGPIDLSYRQPNLYHKQRLLPYSAGFDPVARASETLAALLYLRGDVAPAKGTFAVPFDGEGRLLHGGQGHLPSDLTRLGLLTGFGLSNSSPANESETPDAAQAEKSGGPSFMDSLFNRLPRKLSVAVDKLTGAGDQAFAQRVDGMVAAGRLDPEAARLAKSHVYRSDTGQILLDAPRRSMQVVTPRTEGISFDKLASPQTLGRLTVLDADTSGLVAVSALDGHDVANSRRLLLIFATDAMNTGQKFSDASRRTVVDYGKLPVVIKRGQVRIRLALGTPGAGAGNGAVLRSLRLDGTIGAQLPIVSYESDMEINLDNATEHGPTTFFLLER